MSLLTRTSSALLLLLPACRDDIEELPPLLASSKYIDYHLDGDPGFTVQCLDDLLAREDRFIDRTAAILGVDVPAARIHYVWDVAEADSPWSCDDAVACYRLRDAGDGLVVSNAVTDHHELVHAVEIPALGESGHRLLSEGLADYLGSARSTAAVVDEFPAAFTSSLGPDVDYELALHFVGSLFAAHGPDTYRALRATMPPDANLDEFATVFAAVVGTPLADELTAMTAPVHGLDPEDGCIDGDAPVLPWEGDGLVDVDIESVCGDGSIRFGFHDEKHPDHGSLIGVFVVEIPRAGRYDLTVSRAADNLPVYGALRRCDNAEPAGVGSLDGRTGHGLFKAAGRFVLQLDFRSRPEPLGTAHVRIEYVGPPP